jgi:alginate O-acetyltransferase complex protein AlgI
MFLVALVLFANFKWLTWVGRTKDAAAAGPDRALAYFFGWIGLDADEFCTRFEGTRLQTRDWAAAVGKTLLGATLVWGLVRLLPADRPLLSAGMGFAALIVFVHFGLFHILALVWRQFGVGAEPIMNAPLLATSLADFWGRRWNLAYRRVSFDYFFRPAVSRFGVAAGTLIAFLMSGLVHDLVISFPARTGYGGPTVYFLIQGIGLLLERTRIVRQRFVQCPLLGWFYTLTFVLGPVGLLFHEPFLTRVIGPFLEAIGAR